jgi:hypothetical protein
MKKESTIDMRGMATVFLGWVDLPIEDWAALGYEGEDEYRQVVARLNKGFQRAAQTRWLGGRKVVVAKDKDDPVAAGVALAIKFSEVLVDIEEYELQLAVHFMDARTGSELSSIPIRRYPGGVGGFERHIGKGLEQVGRKLQMEVTRVPARKPRTGIAPKTVVSG